MNVITTEKLPIKIWSENIEDGALEQAKHLANLPFAFKHIALMPDCLADNTEILTNSGFKLISELNVQHDKIANYDPKTKKCFFDYAKNKIIRNKKPNEKLFELASTMLDKSIIVSENHRMSLRANMGEICQNLPKITQIKDYIWGSEGLILDKEYPITDELLCLIAWVVGDGNIRKTNLRKDGTHSSHTVRFGFVKHRKIKRVEHLLTALNFSYNKRQDKNQIALELRTKDSKTIIDFVNLDKNYPVIFIEQLSTRQALLFLEECLKVDGNWTNFSKLNSRVYNTKKENDINFLSSLISLHLGIASDKSRYSEGFNKNIKMHYLSVILNNNTYDSNNGFSKSKITKKEVDYSGKLVCVECTSGFFLARQNGLTFISGNCHQGYGMPIGGVLATLNTIIPNAVGVDIGCGMCAVKTPWTTEQITLPILTKIIEKIKEVVPVGFKKHSCAQDSKLMPAIQPLLNKMTGNKCICFQEYSNALKSLGTLGGGNHFIEIQKDTFNNIWIMLHSGSRNLGLKVANYYNNRAKFHNKRWHSSVPINWDLAYLPLDSEDGQNYLNEMNFCVEFAYANRQKMLENICGIFNSTMNYLTINRSNTINIAHNYANLESHFRKNLMVHRKGATRAYAGEWGIIPGSQGTSSYIVTGCGNEMSFKSCSHGAGRILGRKQAQRTLSLSEQQTILNNQGIIHNLNNEKQLDEAPGAYKDIDVVMENQKDLVNIETKLTPIAVIKG